MAKVKITKKQVIEAIRTEPLRPGHWVQYSFDSPDCKVCAVGGLLRCGFKTADDMNTALVEFRRLWGLNETDKKNTEVALEGGDYLMALSCAFEGWWRGEDLHFNRDRDDPRELAACRRYMTEWVNENLPEFFWVELEGYEPQGNGVDAVELMNTVKKERANESETEQCEVPAENQAARSV